MKTLGQILLKLSLMSVLSNERVGITLEYLLAMKYKLPGNYYTHRFKPSKPLDKIIDTVHSILQNEKIVLKEYSGPLNTYYDFKTEEGNTLSLKSNFKGYKVCPQTIGQISKEKWLNKFQCNSTTTTTDHKVVFMTNKELIVKEYWRNLFPCDHNIWIRYENQDWKATYIHKSTTTTTPFFTNNLETTRTLEQWVESNTVKYQGKSIGEIQIHRNRNCIKFRFNMSNCLKFLIRS